MVRRLGGLSGGVLAVLAVLTAAAAAARVPPSVQVRLSHVSQDQAELHVVKTNSSASQVVVTLTRWQQSDDFQQLKTQFNPNTTSELKKLRFSKLDTGTKYRICSSVRRDGEIVSDSTCFTVTTFRERSLTSAIVCGAVAALIVVCSAALLVGLYKVVLRRRNSKTFIVSDQTDPENGVTNAAVDET